MHHALFVPLLAALACAVCYATGTVLQKVGADKATTATKLDARLLWQLSRHSSYVIGVGLDIAGWLFTLYAVRYLPLFLVEAAVATNIALTALIERLFWGHKLQPKVYLALGVILLGLVLLSLAASPGRAQPISESTKWLVIASPLLIGLLGYGLARRTGHRSALAVAALGGVAFAGTSVVGRIFNVSQPLWHTIYNPLLLALVASGVLGILLFSTALQRAQATVANAVMTAGQTSIAAMVGIVVLGDQARAGLGYLVIIGLGLVLAGVLALAANASVSAHTARKIS